jgi:hypothetical protein
MKKILFLLILTPLFSLGQNTATDGCKLIKENDPFTKQTRLSTGFIELEGGSVTIDADSKEIDIMFSITGLEKCYDNNSTASMYFENVKTKMNIRNAGTMNCEGLFHFIYKNTATANTTLQKLLTQKIDHILIVGNNKKESTITFSPENRDKFIFLATCLVNEAKTLVK